MRTISIDIPLYIADAWHVDQYAAWAGQRADFTIVDTHYYRCFTEEDRAKWGDQHAEELKGWGVQQFRGLSGQSRGNLIVGEFSAALGGHPPGVNDGEKDRQRRAFVRAELDAFEETCGGWFFWTLKKQDGWDAGWSLKNATLAEIMPAYVGKRKAHVPNDWQRDHAKDAAFSKGRIYSSAPVLIL